MPHRLCGLTLMAALATFAMAVPAWAQDLFFDGYGAGPVPSEVARPHGFRQDSVSSPLRAGAGRVAAGGWLPANDSRPAPTRRLHFGPFGPPTQPATAPPVASRRWAYGTAGAASSGARPPGTEPSAPVGAPYPQAAQTPGQAVDGTWRQEGRYLVLNLGGRELRLVKEASGVSRGSAPNPGEAAVGAVLGRLLNAGRPLAKCQVRIAPLAKTFLGYTTSQAATFVTTTDERGVYWFESVPPGAYKLFWLPAGENQWIRRIAMRPDLVVQANETAHVKDIRTALRTLN